MKLEIPDMKIPLWTRLLLHFIPARTSVDVDGDIVTTVYFKVFRGTVYVTGQEQRTNKVENSPHGEKGDKMKTDIDRLHDVVTGKVERRRAGKTFAACHNLAGI